MSVATPPNQTIGDRLKQAKQTQFVGRRRQLQRFDEALSGSAANGNIINVYGPGGVGKSTLLDAFRHHAEAAGARYLYLDAPDFGSSAELFSARLAALLPSAGGESQPEPGAVIRALAEQQRLVIAIDTFEEIGDLNRWLREHFLPGLPENCLIVIAGRHALIDLWRMHPAWHTLIEPMPLANFDRAVTQHYLQHYGVTDPAAVEQVWRYTGGHPLALSLSATLVRYDTPGAAPQADEINIISRLTQRWLREIPERKLRPFIEVAALVRHFNQDLLAQINAAPLSETEFRRLTACSFVRGTAGAWSLHDLVRTALGRELAQRCPERYLQLRIRALCSLAQAAVQPHAGLARQTALQEFFYLLGDSLVRAALYSEEAESDTGLYLESAAADDGEALRQYMHAWRLERGVLASANADVELYDRSSNRRIPQQIIAEPREPEFLDMAELVARFPGAVRLLKDATGRLQGLNIVLPINAQSIDYLERQPVTGSYFKTLDAAQRHQLLTPPQETCNWFVRLIDTRDPGDNAARAMLFRDLTALLIKPARFITTTPLALYQSLLTRFGFRQLDLAPHSDFGVDRPAPFFELDLRGEKLVHHLSALMKQQLGVELELPFDSLLRGVAAAAPVERPVSVPPPEAADAADELPPLSLVQLTPREREVALAAVEGLPNGVIAARLGVTEVTVKKHMGQIFKKAGVRNRAELIRRFWSQAQINSD